MSLELKNIDLNGVVPVESLLNLSGVQIGSSLKETLKINSMRVNKNTGEYYTPTCIIFNYCRYINESQLKSVVDKKYYILVAKKLLQELKDCGYTIGSEWSSNNKLPYSKGNSKLPKTTVIFNLGPASFCVSKNNGLCNLCSVCYALSSERRYLNTLIYRLTQLIRFNELTVQELVQQFKNLRTVEYLRINESGDLFDLQDFKKLLAVCKQLYELKGVTGYLYTHRSDLFDILKELQTPYLKVNRSGVDYCSLPAVESQHTTLFCDGDCKYCLWCKYEFETPVSALLHGDIIGVDMRDCETKKRDLILKWTCYKLHKAGESTETIKEYIKQTLKGEC